LPIFYEVKLTKHSDVPEPQLFSQPAGVVGWIDVLAGGRHEAGSVSLTKFPFPSFSSGNSCLLDFK